MRKRINVSWAPRGGNSPGKVRIEDSNNPGAYIKIVPQYENVSSPQGFFIEIRHLLEFLGWKEDSRLEENTAGGHFLRLSLK